MKKILLLLFLLSYFIFPTSKIHADTCFQNSDCPTNIEYCESDGSGNPAGTRMVQGINGICDPTNKFANKDGCVYQFITPSTTTRNICCTKNSDCVDQSYCQGSNTIYADRGVCDVTNPSTNKQGCVYIRTVVDSKNTLQCYNGVPRGATSSSGGAFERVFGKINPPKELEGLILTGRDSSLGALKAFIANIINVLYFFAAIIFLFMILIGGFDWIRSGGDKGKIEGAQKRITNAVIGIAILGLAFLFTRIVGNILGFNFFGSI